MLAETIHYLNGYFAFFKQIGQEAKNMMHHMRIQCTFLSPKEKNHYRLYFTKVTLQFILDFSMILTNKNQRNRVNKMSHWISLLFLTYLEKHRPKIVLFINSHKLFQNGSHDIGDTFASRSKIVTAWVQEKGHESGYFAKSGDLESQNQAETVVLSLAVGTIISSFSLAICLQGSAVCSMQCSAVHNSLVHQQEG